MLRPPLPARRPPISAGIVAALALIAAETLLLFPLAQVADPIALGVVYLLGVLIVSIVWGAALGIGTSVVSALAFNFFHIPPTGRFTIAEAENWVALAVFLVAAVIAASVAEAARVRAAEAEQRGREADLAAELARVLLGAPDLPARARPRRAADRAGVRARVVPDRARRASAATSGPRRCPLAARRASGSARCSSRRRRARRASATRPALEALLAAALERERARRARSSRRARCAARTRSRPPSCARSRTTCAPR